MTQLTLRQIEVIRAVMLAGSIQGAAQQLNVSAPGVSRLVKHAEDMLGVRLFERNEGLFLPSREAAGIFAMLHELHRQIGSLNTAIGQLRSGDGGQLSFAAGPSIAQFIAARVIRHIRNRFPGLYIDLNILKIEETVDYLLLERGEFVIMSSPIDNPALQSVPLAQGRLVAILPDGHPLARHDAVSIHDLAREDFVGVDLDDPYGEILARPFIEAGITPRYMMRGRFAQTVVSLVRHGLGVAVIDEFSVAEVYMPGLTRRPLVEPSSVTAWAVSRRGREMSSFAEFAIGQFRRELMQTVARRDWAGA